eukprot:TRINITY_DN1872_c0_g1_i1.p1 TRINITY_DN1872_c0_g1~~TRINITY_DN1872_c0_g1_i1.p1  ORF type:complete len:304 (+),score=107.28 TRINITY_DN1872_c0_g1_i1:317-1228(+)
MGKGMGCFGSRPAHADHDGKTGEKSAAAPVDDDEQKPLVSEPAPPPAASEGSRVEPVVAPEPGNVAPEAEAAAAEYNGDAAAAAKEVVPNQLQPKAGGGSPVKVYVVYYSLYGHVAKLAVRVKAGVDSVEGVEGFLFQVPETLSGDSLKKMGGPPKDKDVPVIDVHALVEADAIIFGFPTRFGMMCAQMKQFLDATGSLWQRQALAGKAAGLFFSTGTQGGGQEVTALTAITQLAHHGMLFIPVGYTFQGSFSPEVHGGSPYGAGTYAGDGTRAPNALELDMAEHQGRITAIAALKLKRGAEK